MTVHERPILFSGAMVRALLAGTKTQTRRVIKPPPDHVHAESQVGVTWAMRYRDAVYARACPFGRPGDRLWVRETWAPMPGMSRESCAEHRAYLYAADPPATHHPPVAREAAWRWRPSIHMPREASRIRLEVTGVRVQRVQDISEEDAKAEGVCWAFHRSPDHHVRPAEGPRSCFEYAWDGLNGKRGFGWQANPWVWVVEFKRVGGR